MALFSKKQDISADASSTTAPAKKKAAPKRAATTSPSKDSSQVLLNPRYTEKSSLLMERGVYRFDVAVGANKREIAEAVASVYNVVPRQVRTITSAQRRVIVRNRMGMKPKTKKAYVYLKKGDSIAVV